MKRIKKLTLKCLQKGGRNNQGRITVWHRGGGNKKLYRLIDFKRSLFNVPARILQIQYDPSRTAKIALVCYQNGILSYIIAPKSIKTNDIIQSGDNAEISIGNALSVGLLPIGTLIHNVELKPGKGAQLSRSAGTYAKIIKKDEGKKYILIRLHTGKLFSISPQAMATIGIVSDKNSIGPLYKAGQARWKNRRPVVRGVAMNPIDHPHGGGQGRSKGGGHPVTPWGKLTKGKITGTKKKPSFRRKQGLNNFTGNGKMVSLH